MKWVKYPDLEPISRLKNEGRELYGKLVWLTEKRDGENVSLWLDDSGAPRISSHNQEDAGADIANRMKATPEFKRAVELLEDEKKYHRNLILYGELLKNISPTRIEPKRKHIHWIMFDILDADSGKWYHASKVYQLGYHFKIPTVRMVVLTRGDETPLKEGVERSLEWCKKHRREGVVGKAYGEEPIFFKEKIDLPKLPKIDRSAQDKPNYPPMPQETVIRALQHAYDECVKNGWEWKDKSKAMPLVAKHIALEGQEHLFSPPKSFYQLYIDTPLEVIKK